MPKNSNSFLKDETGAITVDWVVLCAGLVGMSALIASQMSDKAVALGTSISSYMADKGPE